MKRFIPIAVFLLLLGTVAMAQERLVTGLVTDSESGAAVPGANVTVLGSSIGTATDADGKFSIAVPTGATTLVVSFVGYTTQNVSIPSSNYVAVSLGSSANELEEVVISVGRGQQRTIIDNPVPVDNFTSKELATTGQFTFDKALQYRVPSFNTVNTPVNDASTLLDPYEIRNLGPSRTLILINGKRKNLSSLLYVQFAPGRGETGADLSGIPTDAIKRVEILRDGASAQYGSDAIAGVMNVILKDKFEYSSLNVVSGVTGKGDGASYGLTFNSGSNFAKNGFINYTVGFNQTDNAVRSGIIDRPTEIATFNPYGSYDDDKNLGVQGAKTGLQKFQGLGADDVTFDGGLINPAGANATAADLADWNNNRLAQNVTLFSNNVNQFLDRNPTGGNINGTGETSAARFSFNLGIPLSEKTQFYSNAAFVAKKVISNANYRTPYWRSDALLLHRPDASQPDFSVPGNAIEAADKRAGNYKGYVGYMPTFEGDLTDYNATLGLKSQDNGWNTDASITVGGNQQLYTVNNTVNRSAGKASPTSFKPGGFSFSHIVGNIDVSKSLTDKLNFAIGSEARSETYKIIAGDTASYYKEGSNSFPGIRAENARTNSRFNFGAYVDLTYDFTENFLIAAAVRTEKYSDFGSAFVWKLSSRLKLFEDKVVLRGSLSTGFRAPTLHQIYAQSTQASFAGGTIVSSGLFNNISREAFALGIPKLTAEKSDNITLGVGFNPTSDFSLSLDYYNIAISDRIVYSSSITSGSTTSTLGKILSAGGLKSVQFFINGIKTRTEGLDVVASYKNLGIGSGKLGINLAGNFTLNNEIIGLPNDPAAIKADGASILNAQIKSLLIEGRPQFKVIGGLDYAIGNFNVVLNNTMFGPTRFQDLDNGGAKMNNIKQVFSTAVVTDLNVGYAFSKNISASFTVNNLFNILPSWKLELTGSPTDANYAAAKAALEDATERNLLEGFLTFSGRYRILGYNGSQFSQLGTTFMGQLTFKF